MGPNGAGKTTLLHLAVGLLAPSAGTISVPGEATGRALLQIQASLAQDLPLYPRLTLKHHLKMGDWLNPSWDQDFAMGRIQGLGLLPGPARSAPCLAANGPSYH